MSGLQIVNAEGALIIDSDYRHTIVDAYAKPGLMDVGAVNASTPFGNLSALGNWTSNFWPKPGPLYWVRMAKAGDWCFPGNYMFLSGSESLTTSRTLPIDTGIFDVYDATGDLVWNVKSAQDMPRVRDVMRITSAPDNVVMSIPCTYNPWMLLEAFPGWLSIDGDAEILSYSGIICRWTGTQFQVAWIRKNWFGFDYSYGGRGGLSIPLATFSGR